MGKISISWKDTLKIWEERGKELNSKLERELSSLFIIKKRGLWSLCIHKPDVKAMNILLRNQ